MGSKGLSPKQAGRQLKCSDSWVRKLISDGKPKMLNADRSPRGAIVVDPLSVAALVASGYQSKRSGSRRNSKREQPEQEPTTAIMFGPTKLLDAMQRIESKLDVLIGMWR